MPHPPSPRIGDAAPDFTLPDAQGVPTSLHGLLKQGPLVLYFYPKDFTLNCTREACGFRDQHHVFEGAGGHVVGISGDDADSHRRFQERHGLPFPLLSDAGGRVRRLFGVKPLFGLLPGRATFVIDAQGTIRFRFDHFGRPQAHVEGALETLRGLQVEVVR